MTAKKDSIQDKLKELETISNWFETQAEVDVEEGLKKVKQGASLVKELKAKLKVVENEFEELKKEFDNND
jgi:exonuclease VII small subunit